MLGSHNSMSYLPAVHWWQRWQKRWYQCQDKTIAEQLFVGIRYFDIRLNFINDEWHFVHNKIDFGVEDEEVYKAMNNVGEKVYVRFIYDVRKKSNKHKAYKFLAHLYDIQDKYPNIIPNNMITYWDWRNYLSGDIAERELHSGVSSNLLDYLIYGTKRCYAIATIPMIKRSYQFYKDNDKVLLMDYV